MSDRTLISHLDFLLEQSGQDKATLLARALRTSIETLYQEALTEAYLLGKVPREIVIEASPSERAISDSGRNAPPRLNSLVHDPDLRPGRDSWEEARLARQFAEHIDDILAFIEDIHMPRDLDKLYDSHFEALR